MLYCRYNLNGAFIAAHEFLQCDSGWNSEVYHTYDDYIRFRRTTTLILIIHSIMWAVSRGA